MDEENMLKINRFVFSQGNVPLLFDFIILNDIESIRQYVQTEGIQSIDIKVRNGLTPLEYACYYGYNESLRVLLELGADIVTTNTFLFYSIIGSTRNDTTTLKILLEARCNANCIGYDGRTLLHSCAKQGSIAHFKMVLEYGANIYAKNDDGDTPRDIIMKYGYNKDMLDLLDEYEHFHIKEPAI